MSTVGSTIPARLIRFEGLGGGAKLPAAPSVLRPEEGARLLDSDGKEEIGVGLRFITAPGSSGPSELHSLVDLGGRLAARIHQDGSVTLPRNAPIRAEDLYHPTLRGAELAQWRAERCAAILGGQVRTQATEDDAWFRMPTGALLDRRV